MQRKKQNIGITLSLTILLNIFWKIDSYAQYLSSNFCLPKVLYHWPLILKVLGYKSWLPGERPNEVKNLIENFQKMRNIDTAILQFKENR